MVDYLRPEFFGKKLQNDFIDLPNDKLLPHAPEIGPMPYVLVADEAFPLITHIMRPSPGRGLNYGDRIYNYRLSYADKLDPPDTRILRNLR